MSLYAMAGEPMFFTEDDMMDRFDQFLDQCYEQISIFGITQDYSVVAKEFDPIAYREEFLSYIDELIGYGVLTEFED